ncbi:hypothetical protein BSL78_28908 [Apostichopus japonicus]|uniref:Uncharacterized protein n=1 Tax=Stichopus japonicus TaxID=307972 RepID=A0A2G8JEZ0_STIJA|nr:hypothetical protein BSL78_28908 [Apostichopus japonicus]
MKIGKRTERRGGRDAERGMWRLKRYVIDLAVYRGACIEGRIERDVTSFSADLSLLHSRNFGQVPSGAMEQLHIYLLTFDDAATAERLQTRTAKPWRTVVNTETIKDAYTLQEESDGESEQDRESFSSESCKDCPLCCYKVLPKLNLFTVAYKSIGLAYRLLLTLPVSQGICERFFLCLEENKTPF